jgi:hypothetical protein
MDASTPPSVTTLPLYDSVHSTPISKTSQGVAMSYRIMLRSSLWPLLDHCSGSGTSQELKPSLSDTSLVLLAISVWLSAMSIVSILLTASMPLMGGFFLLTFLTWAGTMLAFSRGLAKSKRSLAPTETPSTNILSEHIFKTTGKAFDPKLITRVMGIYFELFPEIRRWHRDLCNRVDGTKRRSGSEGDGLLDPWTLGVCYARNPFGYTHRFYNVLDWEKIGNEWVSSYGEDAKRLVSFLPQSTAAAIIKQAAKRLYYEYPWVGETLRLLIHDSILGEALDKDLDTCLRVSREVMEAPIRELPLDPTWNMGEFLTIGSEAKTGQSWGAMH